MLNISQKMKFYNFKKSISCDCFSLNKSHFQFLKEKGDGRRHINLNF